MRLRLTTWERELIRRNVGSLKRLTVDQFRASLSTLGKVELSQDEKESVGYVTIEGGAAWAKRGYAADIDLAENELAIARAAVSGFVRGIARGGEFDVDRDRNLMRLCEKLGIGFWPLVEEERERMEAAKEEKKRREQAEGNSQDD